MVTKQEERHQTAYYISDSCRNDAAFFARHVQHHWGIENRLHWVKDVIMKEDTSKTTQGMAAENLSVLRNIVCNIFRSNGFDSIKYATELYVNRINDILRLISSKPKKYKIT